MRQTEQRDAPELGRLLRATGLDDNPDPARIARVVLETDSVTLVETEADGALIGLAAGFPTVASDGTRRWEIDLLGVHPARQGRGIGRQLVEASAAAGRTAGAQTARALVRIDNAASLRVFERCGFTRDEAIYQLYVSDLARDQDLPVPPGVHLIRVETLTYSGLWVAGDLSLAALRSAQAARTRAGVEIAGALIPVGALAAEQAGYQFAGQYHWLRRTL